MNQELFETKVSEIKQNLETVQEKIACAAQKVGRDPASVKLIAVTKLMPLEVIRAGISAGMTAFGENYPEQAVGKIHALENEPKIEWHMIGHIQSRKAETVCQYFDMVHSVDRMKIVRHLDRYCGEYHKVMPVLLEVNLSGEESKHGWSAWDEAGWSRLLDPFQEILSYSNLDVRGLMTMPPLFDDPESTRPLYHRLCRLQCFLKENLPESDWEELSIGTSFDYEVAVEEGSTMVRIGTELFGSRTAT